MLSQIVERIAGSDSVRSAVERVRHAPGPIRLSGLVGSAGSIFASILYHELGVSIAVVCPDEPERLRDDLESLLGSDRVFYFPDWEILPYALLGIPSITFGVTLFRQPGKAVRTGGLLLAVSGICTIASLIGIVIESDLLLMGTMIGGLLFTLMFLPLAWGFLRQEAAPQRVAAPAVS